MRPLQTLLHVAHSQPRITSHIFFILLKCSLFLPGHLLQFHLCSALTVLVTLAFSLSQHGSILTSLRNLSHNNFSGDLPLSFSSVAFIVDLRGNHGYLMLKIRAVHTNFRLNCDSLNFTNKRVLMPSHCCTFPHLRFTYSTPG